MESSKDSNPSVLDFWAETWIGSVVLILLSCSVFSLFSLLRLGAWAGGLGALVWAAFRIRRAGCSAFAVPRFHGIGWGIPVLLILCLASILAGPHCFLDTYSYRLPQMFFWLQEGHPWSVPGVDSRINQMPHVWPMLSAAFFLPFGERALALPNFAGLLFLVAIFRRWAARADGPGPKADALALVFLSAPVFLMGASTNDNVCCCCAFLALSYHFADRPEATLRTTALSAFAFALACGIKPQYLALAPVWAAWFFFAPSRPWRTISPKPLLVLLPLLVLCSPVPTLAVNRICWGSFMHPVVAEIAEGAIPALVDATTESPSSVSPPTSSVLPPERFRGERSFATIGLQLFDLPFNPFFGRANRWAESGSGPAARFLRWSGVRFRPFVIPEVASLGFLVAVPFVLGLILSFRGGGRPVFLLTSSVLALTAVAVAYTKGVTLGRSFAGFFLILFPLAVPALGRLPCKAVSLHAALCLLAGIAVIVIDPSGPLLPVRLLSRQLEDRPSAAVRLADYAHYSGRQFATRALLAEIPENEQTIGVLLEDNSPFAEIWLSRPGVRVVPYAAPPDAARLDHDGVRFLLFKSKKIARSGGASEESVLAACGLARVSTISYVSFTRKGPEDWTLLERPF